MRYKLPTACRTYVYLVPRHLSSLISYLSSPFSNLMSRHRTWPLSSSQVCLPLLLLITHLHFVSKHHKHINQLITSSLFSSYFLFQAELMVVVRGGDHQEPWMAIRDHVLRAFTLGVCQLNVAVNKRMRTCQASLHIPYVLTSLPSPSFNRRKNVNHWSI